MSKGWPDPKVVISDKPPVQIAVRNDMEESVVNEVLTKVRRGFDVVMIIYRSQDNRHEVAARSSMFTSITHAQKVMEEATQKLLTSLFGKGTPKDRIVV